MRLPHALFVIRNLKQGLAWLKRHVILLARLGWLAIVALVAGLLWLVQNAGPWVWHLGRAPLVLPFYLAADGLRWIKRRIRTGGVAVIVWVALVGSLAVLIGSGVWTYAHPRTPETQLTLPPARPHTTPLPRQSPTTRDKAVAGWRAKLPTRCPTPSRVHSVVLPRSTAGQQAIVTTQSGGPTRFSAKLPTDWAAYPGDLSRLPANHPWMLGLRRLQRESAKYPKTPIGATVGVIDNKGSLLVCTQRANGERPKRVWDSVAVANTTPTNNPVIGLLFPIRSPDDSIDEVPAVNVWPTGPDGPRLYAHPADRSDAEGLGAGQNQLALVFTWGPGQVGEIMIVGFLPDGSVIWPCETANGSGWRHDPIYHRDEGVQCRLLK